MTCGIILYHIDPDGCHVETAAISGEEYEEIKQTYCEDPITRIIKETIFDLRMPLCFRCQHKIKNEDDWYVKEGEDFCESCYLILTGSLP